MVKIITNQEGKAIVTEGDKAFIPPSPTGTISITENGTYDVSSYGTANVNTVDYLAQKIQNTLVNYVIPEGTTTIYTHALRGCTSLESIVIPGSVGLIRDNAFSGCSSLSSVTINRGVTSFYSRVFEGCAFSSIKIPNTVRSFSSYCFEACSNLAVIDLTDYTSDQTVPSISTTTFHNINSNAVFCFQDQTTLNNFSSATNWSSLASTYTFRVGLPE